MTAAQAIETRENVAAVDRLLIEAVADGVAPGLVGAVADRSGLLHESVHGARAAGGDRAMTGDTIFWLASMTKLVTSVAAMQLVETDDLDLDGPVAALLPELAEPLVVTGTKPDGTPLTRPARGAITLRHLLTHTAGSGYDQMYPALLAARGAAGPPRALSLASLEGPLATDPGGGWTYGYGHDWAGIMVERKSGLSLDAWFAERIVGPLAMRDTGFAVAAGALDRVAATHWRDAAGGVSVVPSPLPPREQWEFLSGGAGLSGTAADYCRLLRMLLRGGELDGVRVLRAATVNAMWDDQIGDLVAGRLGTADDAYLKSYDPLPGQDGGWSLLGAYNRRSVLGGRRIGSAGWTGVGGTFFWLDRAADLCGVLLAQVMPFADPALVAIQLAFERAAYADAARSRGRA